jgi:hypothetical protein
VYKISKDIQSLDVNSVFDKNRNILNPILNIGKMFFKGIKVINYEFNNELNGTLTIFSRIDTQKELHKQVERCFNMSPLLDIANGLYYKNKLNLLMKNKRSPLLLDVDGNILH